MATLAVLLPWGWAWAQALDDQFHPATLQAALIALALGTLVVIFRGPGSVQACHGWLLRYDGQQWHWWAQPGPAQGAQQDSSLATDHGCGTLHRALGIGPWWLLKACPADSRGRVAWMWLRADAWGQEGRRLRALLAWS